MAMAAHTRRASFEGAATAPGGDRIRDRSFADLSDR